jgi:endoglucanase
MYLMQKIALAAISLLFLIVAPGNYSYAVQKGDVICRFEFDKRSDLSVWEGTEHRRLRKKDKISVLRISARYDNGLLHMQLPMEMMRGCKIAVTARIKGKKVAVPLHPWNGVKVMVHYRMGGEDYWPQLTLPLGSFDWQKRTFSTFIAPHADTGWLVIGLEETKGKVWFDYVEVSVLEPPRSRPEQPATSPMYKSHIEDRLRGAMVHPLLSELDMRTLASWGANHIRLQLTWAGFPGSPADSSDLPEYFEWLEHTLQHIDSLLPICKELHLKVLIDLHTMPGGMLKTGLGLKIFNDKKWQDAFIEVWENIAARYKNESVIWGYDLANEPVEYNVAPGLMGWQRLAETVAKNIRKIDRDHAIIVESVAAASPYAFISLNPIDVPGIVYSFHFYEPGAFTHQGLFSDSAYSYPGIIKGVDWNKERLRQAMQQVIDFQNDYNVPIYVGEFSAIRWAPDESAYNYIHDCIEIFEEQKWDWAYHAFRESNVWSVEHGSEKNNDMPSASPTLREQLLKDAFKKNKE